MKIKGSILFILLLINGCTIPAYITNSPHTPLFKDQNELNVEAVYGLSGLEAKTSFSFSQNLFVFGGAAFSKSDTVLNFSRNIYEGGIGYYKYLDVPFHIPFLIKLNHIELLAGYGSGKSFGDFESIVDSAAVRIQGKYKRYFFQVNLGLSNNREHERFEFTTIEEYGQAFRLSFVDFYKFEHENKIINKHLSNLFFEYFIFSRIGIGNFKIELTGGYIIPFNRDSEFGSSFFTIGAGAVFNFNL